MDALSSFHDQPDTPRCLRSGITHLELLIEVLAKNGTAKVADLYESPFTLRARGPEDLFTDAQIDAIEAVLQDIRTRVQPRAS